MVKNNAGRALIATLALVLSVAFVSPAFAAGEGAKAFTDLKCNKCHSVTSAGIKPIKEKKTIRDLSSVGKTYKADWLTKWLKKEVKRDSDVKKGTQVAHKAKFKGDAKQLTDLVAWMVTLKK